MKSIFLGSEFNIKRVYTEEQRKYLEQNAGLDGAVYTKESVIENAPKFKDVELIFSTWGMPHFSVEEIKSTFPSLKCVFYAAGTVQGFAREFLACGVKVFSAWAANAVPVAEYTVAQIVLANKGFFAASAFHSAGDTKTSNEIKRSIIGNFGVDVGIIGAGMIGKLVIKMLKNYRLGAKVFDPFLSDDTAAELGIKKCSLEELFSTCTVVSNHLANNEQTRGMLNYALFSKMVPNSAFINTGRGAQVVEDDLQKVLSERPDITAILDVTYPEPPEEGHPFYSLKNCIMTPHIAGSIGNEVVRMAEYMIEEYEKYANGEQCLYEVNEKMLETMA